MGVEAGAVLPHAPLIAKGDRADLDLYVRSVARCDQGFRGLRCGRAPVEPRSEGRRLLGGEGRPRCFRGEGGRGERPNGERDGERVGRGLGARPISDRADHGVVGTISIAAQSVPVVACTLAEITGPYAPGTVESAVESGLLFADALQQVAGERRLGFIAERAHGRVTHSEGTACPQARGQGIGRPDPRLPGDRLRIAGARGPGALERGRVVRRRPPHRLRRAVRGRPRRCPRVRPSLRSRLPRGFRRPWLTPASWR